MKFWVLSFSLLASAALAQTKCQSRCLDNGCTASCQDDRCMRRCSDRTQSCMAACEKTEPAATQVNKVKMNGTCPGPNGRLMPCDQIPQSAPDEATLKNMMAHPPTKKKDREKDEASVPHQMPTAENYQQLMQQHKAQQKNK